MCVCVSWRRAWGWGTQSACEVLWLTTCVFETLSFHVFFFFVFFFFPRVRGFGGWGVLRVGSRVMRERERIKEPGLRHVVLVWRDGGSGFSLLQPARPL